MVEGVSLHGANVVLPEAAGRGKNKTDITEELVDETEVSPPSPIEDGSNGEEGETEDGVKGVIRLLQEGHFKGVADVRLRINFAEELTALVQGELGPVAEEKVGEVLDSVGANAELALEWDEPIEGLATAMETFEATVNESKDDFLNSETPSIETLLSEVQSAFDSLMEFIKPSEPQEEGTDEPDAESSGEDDDALSSFVENLRTIFAAAKETLQNALNDVTVVPELSEARGNGVAYDKFLAI